MAGRLMGNVYIDLGEEHGTVAEREWRAPPRRVRWADGARRRARSARLAVGLVLALVLGGAAVSPRAPLRLVARVPVAAGASFLIDGDRMLVLGGGGRDGPPLAQYSLADGARIWSATVTLAATSGSMRTSDGVVLVSGYGHDAGGHNTDAVDERTGRLLWHSTRDVLLPLPGTGTALMSDDAIATNVVATVELVDLRTGVPRWTAVLGDCLFTLNSVVGPGTPLGLARLCPRTGLLTLIDLTTGAIRATQVAAPPAAPFEPGSTLMQPQLTSVGGAVVVEQDGAGKTLIEAYRWNDLTPMWSRTGFGVQDVLYSCDGYVCVDNLGLGVAIDPVDGADASSRAGHADTDLVAASFRYPAARTLVLVPPGRTGPPEEAGQLVEPVQPMSVGLPLPTFTPGTTLVAVVDPAGGVRALQQISGVRADSCTGVAGYLVCPTAVDRATVWRLPDG